MNYSIVKFIDSEYAPKERGQFAPKAAQYLHVETVMHFKQTSPLVFPFRCLLRRVIGLNFEVRHEYDRIQFFVSGHDKT